MKRDYINITYKDVDYICFEIFFITVNIVKIKHCNLISLYLFGAYIIHFFMI